MGAWGGEQRREKLLVLLKTDIFISQKVMEGQKKKIVFDLVVFPW